MKAKILTSTLDHPYYHLSLEDYYLKHALLDGPQFIFYINRPSVVIGRNQNPWLECVIPALKENQVILGRRTTGGGAVYHDYGNLNYAVIYRQGSFSETAVFDWLQNGFKHFGLTVEVGLRKELLINGLKLSGTAFGHYRDRIIQHGTLLIDADLKALKSYLTINPLVVQSRSVSSVPSQVTNLSEWVSELKMEDVIVALIGAVPGQTESVTEVELDGILSSPVYRDLLAKHQSWKWLYGETPGFCIKRPEEGAKPLNVKHGRVECSLTESDSSLMEAFMDIRTG